MKFRTALLVGMVLALGTIVFVHQYQSGQITSDLARINTLWQRQEILKDLELAYETHRLVSKDFRKLSEYQRTDAKNDLRNAVTEATTKLDKLDPTPEEDALGRRLNQQIADFLVLSAKLEPMLFLRDVYLKPDARQAHEAMLKTITALEKSASSRRSEFEKNKRKSRANTGRAVIGATVLMLALIGALMMSGFSAYIHPLKKLLARVREIRAGQLKRKRPSALKGEYGEIEQFVDSLAMMADSQRRERHHFVTSVATDLKSSLIPLQTGAALLASKGETLRAEERHATSELVRRSVLKLSHTLDDLTDLVNCESGVVRLDEKIVDLREVVEAAASVYGISGDGTGSLHPIRLDMPPMPVWALIDSKRVERVLINLIGKLVRGNPQGNPEGSLIQVSLNISGSKSSRGAEVVIYFADQPTVGDAASTQTNRRPTGPETELLRHWISQNGFGMTLSQQIISAHGGQITAAGVAGTQVIFSVRLPEERLPGVQAVPGFQSQPLTLGSSGESSGGAFGAHAGAFGISAGREASAPNPSL